MALYVGCQFSSFEELEVAVKRYQEQTGTQLYKRDSRTVEAASKRNTRKNYKEEIRYSEINYFCVHGGKLYRSEEEIRYSLKILSHENLYVRLCRVPSLYIYV